MKSFFVKIGKVTNSIRKEGVFRGGQKVAGYLGVFLKSLVEKKTGDILFITGGVGDSARYRAFNVTEELNLHGLSASAAMSDDPFLLRYVDKFKVFIFHKTIFTPKMEKLVEKIRAQKKEIIFDADDLLFDPKYQEKIDYFRNTNVLEKKSYETGLGKEILTNSYVKTCTASTSFLADILRNHGKKVFIVPNKLSGDDLRITEKIRVARHETQFSDIKIGYFSGSFGHNKDFATITDALISVMEKYPAVKLFLAGPLNMESALNRFRDRIVQLPFVSRKNHFKNISEVDIGIAPLEIGNPFCESKSELKFFEAGILGVPTVAVRNQTFNEAIIDGVDGFLASSTLEWIEKIGKLIEDEGLRKTMGEKARQKCLKKYTNKNSGNEEYYNYLRSELKSSSSS
ncbi:MAG: glycosyltransferase [Patescibacteria group bacterium]